MSIGSMTSSLVNFKIAAIWKTASGTINVQNILNDIFPGLLPLGLTFLMYYLLNKKVKVIYLILGIFILAIAGVYLNILR